MYDPETKLYYLQARYYDPATARFVSRDPDPGDEDDPVTMNGYTYADGNPVMNTDPDGHWAWAVVNAGFAHRYHYDGSQLVRITDTGGRTVWAFTWNAGKLVQVTNAAGESFEAVTNRRGDVVRLLDKAGNTVAEYDYDPWGNLVSTEPNDSRIKGQPVRYAGYVYDTETKLYYLQARYYDPATARFISRDPDPGDEDDPITMNGYAYADNNPIMMVDPDGKRAKLIIKLYQKIPYKIEKVGRIKGHNDKGKGYWGIIYSKKKKTGKKTSRSIEWHTPHNGHGYHIQRNKYSKYEGKWQRGKVISRTTVWKAKDR